MRRCWPCREGRPGSQFRFRQYTRASSSRSMTAPTDCGKRTASGVGHPPRHLSPGAAASFCPSCCVRPVHHVGSCARLPARRLARGFDLDLAATAQALGLGSKGGPDQRSQGGSSLAPSYHRERGPPVPLSASRASAVAPSDPMSAPNSRQAKNFEKSLKLGGRPAEGDAKGLPQPPRW
jgi:hypothetical protein